MKKLSLLIFLILMNMSCKKETQEQKRDNFNLSVTAKNFPDSTKVILYNRDIDMNIDSTYVINQSFKLSGKVYLPSLSYLFFYGNENKRINQYKYLFIENNNISIIGEYSDFFNAKVTGSKQTELLTEYNSISVNNNESKNKTNQLDFLYSNANNQMALNELLYKKKEISKDSLLLFHKKLDTTNSNSPKGQELLAYINAVQVKIGDRFRDIWGNDLNGVKHKLSDYYGKVILLDFWSPDCPHSKEQHKKELPKLVQKYNHKDFIIISYCIDMEKEGWKNTSEKNYNNWLNISDLKGMKGANISEYDVTGTPANFLINKDGIIVKSFNGFYEGENRIEKEIDQLMN